MEDGDIQEDGEVQEDGVVLILPGASQLVDVDGDAVAAVDAGDYLLCKFLIISPNIFFYQIIHFIT